MGSGGSCEKQLIAASAVNNDADGVSVVVNKESINDKKSYQTVSWSRNRCDTKRQEPSSSTYYCQQVQVTNR